MENKEDIFVKTNQKLLGLIKKWGFSVIAVFLGGTLIFAMLTDFNRKIQQELEKNIHITMTEINQTAIIALNNNISAVKSLLEKQAEVFGMIKNPTDDEILSRLKKLSTEEGFKNVSIITYDNKLYSTVRGITRVQMGDNTPNLLKKHTIISQPRIFFDDSLVVDISTPVYLDAAEAGKLVISLDSKYIADLFTENLMEGDAAFNLIAGDGTVITRISNRPSPIKPNSNIFDFYKSDKVKLLNGSTQELSMNMDNKSPMWIQYDYLGQKVCVLFTPFGINDWYMAIAATDFMLQDQSAKIYNNTKNLSFSIMAIVVMVSIIVIIQRINEQKRIDTIKNTYSVAIKKTNDLFYEANIDSDEFVDYSEQKEKTIWKEAPKNYSNALIQVANICAPECRQQFLDTFLPQNIRIKIKEGISSINFEYKIIPDENTVRWLSATFVPVNDGSGNTKLICMENDITDDKRKQESLKTSATIDGLSGLYNKVTTKNYIEWYLANEGCDGEHAMIIIDIDHFKSVNDNLGHIKGDEVIVEFSQALKKIFRKSDIVGRIGGDEFIVLIKDCNVLERIVAKMYEVKNAISKEHYLEGDQLGAIKTTASIGIALYSNDGKTFDQLYKNADIALYTSKANGRDRFTFYDESMKPFSITQNKKSKP